MKKAKRGYEKAKLKNCKARIEFLMQKNKLKVVTPQIIVADAQNKASPLHSHFEWDDNKASYQYRLYQARKLLGMIIETIDVGGQPVEVRSFFNVKNVAGEQVYVTVNKVASSKNYRNQVIEDCLQYIKHFTGVLEILKNLK